MTTSNKIIFEMNRRSLVEQNNRYSTPDKRRNSMTKSQFLSNSVNRNSVNPEDVLQSFFKRNPFDKFKEDITIYKPVSNVSPGGSFTDRNYVIVDEKQTLGKPISPAEFERIMSRKTQEHQIITYGDQKVRDRARLDIEVKEQKGRSACGCCGGCATCCGDNKNGRTAYVQNYE